jgi:hypothetical protein
LEPVSGFEPLTVRLQGKGYGENKLGFWASSFESLFMEVLGSALGCRSVAVLSCCTAAVAEVLTLVDVWHGVGRGSLHRTISLGIAEFVRIMHLNQHHSFP